MKTLISHSTSVPDLERDEVVDDSGSLSARENSPLARHRPSRGKPAFVPKLPLGRMHEKLQEAKVRKRLDKIQDKLRQKDVLPQDPPVAKSKAISKKAYAQLQLLMDRSKPVPSSSFHTDAGAFSRDNNGHCSSSDVQSVARARTHGSAECHGHAAMGQLVHH